MKGMNDAYKAAADFIRDEMNEEDGAGDTIRKLKPNDILVVKGDHDRIEDVFSASNTPHKVIRAPDLSHKVVDPDQILFVNCIGEGKFQKKGIDQIRNYVDSGGCLVTTDWALKSVVEKAFPGYIKYNGYGTKNDVVGVRFCCKNHPFLLGLGGKALKPQWWLETQSYPINIIDKSVNVLIESSEMKSKYYDGNVVVEFPFGKGKVIHMVSHYYLQQTKANRSGMTAEEFARDILGLSGVNKSLDGITADSFESAYTSARFVHNIVAERQK